MGRPDESILKEVNGYKFKKDREDGEIHVMSPGGVNFKFDYKVMKKFIEDVENNKEIKDLFEID